MRQTNGHMTDEWTALDSRTGTRMDSGIDTEEGLPMAVLAMLGPAPHLIYSM